eukprot:5947578-Prorocentrum_lima.AAC.1
MLGSHQDDDGVEPLEVRRKGSNPNLRPHEHVRDLTIVSDASLAPGEEGVMKGVTVFYGPNFISWRSGKQSLTALSSCEAELV